MYIYMCVYLCVFIYIILDVLLFSKPLSLFILFFATNGGEKNLKKIFRVDFCYLKRPSVWKALRRLARPFLHIPDLVRVRTWGLFSSFR